MVEKTESVAWITGAGRGIGRAISLRLAADGFTVAINDVDEGAVHSVQQEIEAAGGHAIEVPGDITHEITVTNIVTSIVETFGRLDVLIANAGVVHVNTVMDTTLEDFDRVYNVNVRGVFLCGREAGRQMMKQGSGKIINAASTAGHEGFEHFVAYSSSKFAVVGMTQCMAKDFASHGITVNAYCPGIVDTPMWDHIDEVRSKLMGMQTGAAREAALKTVPLGRQEEPEDVANLVSFLASSDSNYITGQAIQVCGGTYMQ